MDYSLDKISSLYIGLQKKREILDCMNDLHPELKKILDRELESGNRVQDASRDWPENGSIFITLRDPFHGVYSSISKAGYSEPGDPHYWTADYSFGTPLHVVAH